MDTIVFISSNKSGTSREALRAAKELGYAVILFTDRPKFKRQREEFPEVDVMIYFENLNNKELIKVKIKELAQKRYHIKACLSLVDPFVSLASSISEEMGFAKLSTRALYLMEDKTRFREELKELSANPFFSLVKPEDLMEEIIPQFEDRLPLILKSPQSNGSKDVLLVKTKQELIKGIEQLRYSVQSSPILIEEYIEGAQYLVEVVAWKGKIHIVAIIEQDICLNERFIVTGYCYPASLSETQTNGLEEVVREILCKLGMASGSCHLELRYSKGEWKLIEINPRMSGGAMNKIISEGTGISLVNEIIKMNLNQDPDLSHSTFKHVYAKFMTISSYGKLLMVTGKKRAQSHDGVKDVYIKPRKGAILNPPLSMGDRYAYIIAAGSTRDEAKQIAINAAKEIRFYLENL
ncbi:ATP-grasp domain-containing protein [Neobacillus dielmonensis]|uniref:ATP-grasp domain-containing protein n=1 Tax=Neobacillus dielmonensis TaxID=1347369 RepID=UPI0005A6F8BD|nr:ATP-grasp domain-containing protein [Neobacillus dielmonensis]